MITRNQWPHEMISRNHECQYIHTFNYTHCSVFLNLGRVDDCNSRKSFRSFVVIRRYRRPWQMNTQLVTSWTESHSCDFLFTFIVESYVFISLNFRDIEGMKEGKGGMGKGEGKRREAAENRRKLQFLPNFQLWGRLLYPQHPDVGQICLVFAGQWCTLPRQISSWSAYTTIYITTQKWPMLNI